MQLRHKTTLMAALMLLVAALANAFQPTIYMAEERQPINLGKMVPTAFGDWREQPYISAQIVNPEQKETLQRIYSETLTRMYVNNEGYRVMLSIAYGKNQKKGLELHKPEVCYPAQGFELTSKVAGSLDLQGRSIAATRLVTNLGPRNEPVTYWTVVGDRITAGSLSKRWAETRYGIENRIPDGMLVRVSSIDKNAGAAFEAQAKFSAALVGAISPDVRSRFAGE
jgi:EpsI family protein